MVPTACGVGHKQALKCATRVPLALGVASVEAAAVASRTGTGLCGWRRRGLRCSTADKNCRFLKMCRFFRSLFYIVMFFFKLCFIFSHL